MLFAQARQHIFILDYIYIGIKNIEIALKTHKMAMERELSKPYRNTVDA